MVDIGDVLDGRYRIDARLGVGATATVFRAADARLDRGVALKLLRADLAEDAALAERFDREARALAAIHHPAVVAIHDVAAADPAAGRPPYYVMELCEGGSLADRIAASGRLSPDELVPILSTIAGGLAELHVRGLVHRDVKPSNILLAADGARLGDFGLARDERVDRDASPAGVEGTLAYLAPERLTGAAAKPGADVYALGAVAYLGLTGRPHRPTGTLTELVARGPARPPAVSVALPELGPAFDEAVGRSLDPRPEARPDAVAFAVALVTALGRWTRAGRPGSIVAPTLGIVSATASPERASGAQPADDPLAVTTEALSAPAEPTEMAGAVPAAPARPGDRSDRRAGRRMLGNAAVLAAAAVATVLVAGLISAANQAASPSPSPQALVGSPSPSPTTSPSPTPASPSPSASPDPTPSPPSPSPVDPLAVIEDAVADVRQAIDGARGGQDGLRGKEANDLDGRAAAIGRSADDGDLDEAIDRTDELRERVERLVERDDLAERRAEPILVAIDELRAAIEAAIA